MLLSRLLLDYQTSGSDPKQKRLILSILPEVTASFEGRQAIEALFFHEQKPEMAAAMYAMLLEADLKDAALIADLIARDGTESDPDYKLRLLDLVADHNTVEQPYYREIDDFLARMALHSDKSVRLSALSQWVWYVHRHQGLALVLDAYLFSHSGQVRQEIYEMVETGRIIDEAEKADLALALDSLTHAHYLELKVEEKARIASLKAQLSPGSLGF